MKPIFGFLFLFFWTASLNSFEALAADVQLSPLLMDFASKFADQFPLMPFLPAIKNQGIRGTCSAFATTTAVEIAVAKATQGQDKVELSPQALYNFGKMFWPLNSPFDEGYNVGVFLEKSKSTGYRIPLQSLWAYNSSPSRIIENKVFVHSCDGYTANCSDTAHQGELICAKNSNSLYECGYLSPIENPALGAQITDYQQLWDPLQPQAAVSQAATLLTQAGFPIVVDVESTSRLTARTRGFVYPASTVTSEVTLGIHSMALVGFISSSQLKSLSPSIVAAIPQVSLDSGDDFFITMNSWGPTLGDSGFYYIPKQYLIQYANSILAIKSVDYKK